MLQIKVLNNLSSKYTQEFSLAVIRFKTLKQSINCQGVCSSLRYSIYKVQCADRRSGEPDHNNTSFTRCQELFSFLINFFLMPLRCFAPLAGALEYNTKDTSNCQALFSLFLTYFSRLFPRLSITGKWLSPADNSGHLYDFREGQDPPLRGAVPK